ncbi:MAG: aminodeoxychorismate/anthranilate synthase component II [Candidatus Omnitrophota bacterium]
MLIVIDNYDSFTYNLVQYFGELKQKLIVFRNDKVGIGKLKSLKPKYIVISPGPGRPQDAGISNEAIIAFAGGVPILGVCLGHQCIAQVFGGKITCAKRLMHGKTSHIYHNGKTIFKNVPNPFEATRYHSLIAEKKNLPGCLRIIGETKEKEVMAIQHKKYPIWGVQFHPESVLTIEGKRILKNFLECAK